MGRLTYEEHQRELGVTPQESVTTPIGVEQASKSTVPQLPLGSGHALGEKPEDTPPKNDELLVYLGVFPGDEGDE